jgi:hypothetical protein
MVTGLVLRWDPQMIWHHMFYQPQCIDPGLAPKIGPTGIKRLTFLSACLCLSIFCFSILWNLVLFFRSGFSLEHPHIVWILALQKHLIHRTSFEPPTAGTLSSHTYSRCRRSAALETIRASILNYKTCYIF